MFQKGGYPSFSPGPDPDYTSGATAFRTTSLSEHTASSPKMSPPPISQRAKPVIPQKKTHIDDVFRMKKELEEAIRARDEAVEMKDLMAEDLLTAQEALDEKEEELRKSLDDVRAWKEEVEKLSNRPRGQSARQSRVGTDGERELVQMRQRIDQLTDALVQKDLQLIEKASTATESQGQSETLMREAQLRFDSETKQREDQWRSQFAQEQTLRLAAEADLKSTREHYESRIRETEQLATTRIEEERKRTQATESALNEQMNRMQIDSQSQQQHEQLIARYEAEINNQRRRCDQFRKTSERLTTQIKQAAEAQRERESSDQEVQQRIEDMKSKITALQLQLRDYRMPGSYDGYPSQQFTFRSQHA